MLAGRERVSNEATGSRHVSRRSRARTARETGTVRDDPDQGRRRPEPPFPLRTHLASSPGPVPCVSHDPALCQRRAQTAMHQLRYPRRSAWVMRERETARASASRRSGILSGATMDRRGRVSSRMKRDGGGGVGEWRRPASRDDRPLRTPNKGAVRVRYTVVSRGPLWQHRGPLDRSFVRGV